MMAEQQQGTSSKKKKRKNKEEIEQKTSSKKKTKTKTKNSKKKTKKTQQAASKKKKETKKVVPGKSPKYFLRDKKNKTAYFDISIGGDDSKRMEMIIFNGIVPKTAANFLSFCKGKKINKKTLKYKGTSFHRMIIGFMLQGGDVLNNDGTGLISSL